MSWCLKADFLLSTAYSIMTFPVIPTYVPPGGFPEAATSTEIPQIFVNLYQDLPSRSVLFFWSLSSLLLKPEISDFARCSSSEPIPPLLPASEYSVLPPYKESTILPPFSSGPSGPVGLIRGEFSALDCTKFYASWGFLGDFQMFDLHSSRDTATFVVMGDLISHCSECAEFESAFRDSITGVWLSLSIFLPYHFGSWHAPWGSISRTLYCLGHPVTRSLIRPVRNMVHSLSTFPNFFPQPSSFLEVPSGFVKELSLNGDDQIIPTDSDFLHLHIPESFERGALVNSMEGLQIQSVDDEPLSYDYLRSWEIIWKQGADICSYICSVIV